MFKAAVSLMDRSFGLELEDYHAQKHRWSEMNQKGSIVWVWKEKPVVSSWKNEDYSPSFKETCSPRQNDRKRRSNLKPGPCCCGVAKYGEYFLAHHILKNVLPKLAFFQASLAYYSRKQFSRVTGVQKDGKCREEIYILFEAITDFPDVPSYLHLYATCQNNF